MEYPKSLDILYNKGFDDELDLLFDTGIKYGFARGCKKGLVIGIVATLLTVGTGTYLVIKHNDKQKWKIHF